MNPPPWVDINHRPEIGQWLNKHGLNGQGVEVGSLNGQFARLLLQDWKCTLLYMVDPWEKQDPAVYRENTNDHDFAAAYEECRQMAEADKRIRLVRGYSPQVCVRFEDASLDFIHIDGNHAYVPVLDDLNAWWPKLKSGGVFSGDDYYNDTNYPSNCEVKAAVDRWMSERHLTFTVCRRPAWWCVKP